MEIRAVVCCMVVVFVCASVRTEACSDTDCVSSDGQVCSGHGVCDCGTCVCEGNYTGPNCEQCPGCQSPCALFRDCVQCKTFGTGSLGIVDCINRCEYLANYNPLEAAPAGGIGGMTVCEIDDEEGCVFTFKIGASSEGYRNLYIDTELDCPVYEPTDSTPEEYDPEYVTEDVIEGQVSSTTGTTDIGDTTVGAKGNVKTTEQNKNTAKPEHPKQQTPGVVSGSENTHVSDNLSHQDNAARIMSVSMATVTVCLLFVLGL